MRYYVYSIEYGYTPYNPYSESDDLSECIKTANAICKKFDCTVYVVDRCPLTMYEEIYMAPSTNFRRVYNMRYE